MTALCERDKVVMGGGVARGAGAGEKEERTEVKVCVTFPQRTQRWLESTDTVRVYLRADASASI
jgi:hypothetical protein